MNPGGSFERAGNYGAPAALLCLVAAPTSLGDAFRAARRRALAPDVLRRARIVLVAATAMLLIGHGALGVIGKKLLVTNYAPVLGAHAVAATPIVGWIEIAAGALIVVWHSAPFALGLCAWKILTESLFFAAGAPLWEFVERGGSMVTPLALALVLELERRNRLQQIPAS